jgi:acyl-CoA synthetase (NDP forming)
MSGVEDFLEYVIGDSHTKVVAMIVEQFRQPARFLSLVRKARAAGKAVVLLHPGSSSAARESAATHTGAMTGDFAVDAVGRGLQVKEGANCKQGTVQLSAGTATVA